MIQRAAILIGVTLLHAWATPRILETPARRKPTRLNQFILWGLTSPIPSLYMWLKCSWGLALPTDLERRVTRPMFFLNSLVWGWAALKLLSR